MSDARTDPDRLRGEAYADSGNLAARISIYAYRDDDVDLIPWVLEQVGWPAPGPVLDVGCGPGRYLEAIDGRRVASDLSFGMVAEAVAASGSPGLQAEVARLPVRDGSMGRVLAPHMLYHAADPAAAVAELHRVLGEEGDLVVVLNAGDHLGELREATEAAAGTDLGWERLTSEDAVPLLAAVLLVGGGGAPAGPPPGHRRQGGWRLCRQQRVPPRRPLGPPLARGRRPGHRLGRHRDRPTRPRRDPDALHRPRLPPLTDTDTENRQRRRDGA